MLDDDLAGASGPTLLEYHRLCNARAWNAERLDEAQRHGYLDDAVRYRTNIGQLDQRIKALLRHAEHRERCSEHHVGDE
jgi:hypothetical protein